jgi:hypothetical protein
VVRLAVARGMHTTLLFPKNAALQIMNYVVSSGTEADWWDDDFKLIPNRSQH